MSFPGSFVGRVVLASILQPSLVLLKDVYSSFFWQVLQNYKQWPKLVIVKHQLAGHGRLLFSIYKSPVCAICSDLSQSTARLYSISSSALTFTFLKIYQEHLYCDIFGKQQVGQVYSNKATLWYILPWIKTCSNPQIAIPYISKVAVSVLVLVTITHRQSTLLFCKLQTKFIHSYNYFSRYL